MTQVYTIFGRQVGSHILAMLTLGTTGAGIAWGMSGGSKQKAEGPPINASSKEEEQFIQEFIKAANEEGEKAKQ